MDHVFEIEYYGNGNSDVGDNVMNRSLNEDCPNYSLK